MRERSDADLFQFMFDEMCNTRIRFVIEGEFNDVDAFMYEDDLTSNKEPVLIAEGHGDDICEALDDLIEQHNRIADEETLPPGTDWPADESHRMAEAQRVK